MIRHIVLLKFRSDLDENKVEKAVERFFTLREATGEVQAMEHGINSSPEGLSHGYTHCFLINFADEAARGRYLAHHAHEEFLSHIMPLLADGLVVDFEPTSSARTAHMRRTEKSSRN